MLPFGKVVAMPVPHVWVGWAEVLEVVEVLVFCAGWTTTVTVTVVLKLAVTVLPGPLTVIVLFTPVVTVLAGPFRPGVKF